MKRRNLIALVAAGMLVTIAFLLIGAILVITRTRWGQDFVRGQVAERIAPLARGRPPYIGHIDLSSFLTRLTVDSVTLYDASGDVFFSCGRFEARYDWRDIPDSRIALHTVNVEHPYLHLRQHANDAWNFSELFRSSAPSRGPKPAGFSWGDYITADSVGVHDATFILSMPWRPDDTLHGAAIDSAIRRELLRTDHIIRRTADGFERIRTWSHATIFVPYLRLADPDSDRRSGKVAEVGDLRVEESDPPFIFRHLAGMVRLHDDSLLLSVSHFDLPASTGEAQGTVVWGGAKPARYDLHIHADSVALNDVNWVYPALPRTGGGKTLLTIRNERDLRIVDYRLDSMDLWSTKSHLTGSMTFGAGAPVLIVRDVNVVADPIDFDFIRTLNGKDFPIDWRGQIRGTARGPGGPVTAFVVDDTRGEWRDTHVPGAVSQFGGHGELNILDPAITAFHNFQLTLGSLDLRSIEYLFPSFPRLKGTVSGTATLDSSWEDVRFHDADLTHGDGPGDESHFTGNGRVTVGTPQNTYDVSLNAQPISFDLLARTYPNWVLHGTLNGPIRIVGKLPDLDVKATLRGTPGAFSFDGRVDLDSASGYKVNGQGELVDLDLPKISGDRIPFPGKASGHYDVELTDLFVPSKLAGVAAVDLESSVIDHTPVSRAHVRAKFVDGAARLSDGLQASGPGWAATATGGIGLPNGGVDSLRVVFETDSLTEWRPYLPAALASLSSDRDSIEVTVSGRMDSTFAFHDGRAWAQRVAFGLDTNPLFSARNVSATFGIETTLSAPHGQFAFWANTLQASTLDLDTLSGTWQLVDLAHSGFTFAVAHAPGLTAQLGGTVTFSGAAQTWRFDQGFVTPDSAARWQLDSIPALISLTGTNVDTLAFGITNGRGGYLRVAGRLPDSAAVSIDVSAQVPLNQVADVAEHPLPLAGDAGLTAHIRGTRAKPEITYATTIARPAYADVHLAAFTARGGYREGRSFDTLTVFRDSTISASAELSIPVGLSLPFGLRLFPDSALSGHAQGGNVDLGFLQPFFPDVKASGTVGTQSLGLQGTWRQPRLIGAVTVHGARVQIPALGNVVLDSLNGRVRFTTQGITIDSLHAHSGAGRGDHSAMLTGSIEMLPTRTGWSQLVYPSAFDTLTFSANDFAVFNDRTRATVNIQTVHSGSSGRQRPQAPNALPLTRQEGGIQLDGPLDGATLTGNLIVLKSELYLPDTKLASKQPFASADSVASLSSAGGQATWLDRVITGLRLQGDTVTLGDNVTLKSLPDDPNQVNVKLTGTLIPAVSSQMASGIFGGQGFSDRLALQGTLQALAGGQYTFSTLGAGRTFTVISPSTISYDGTANNFLNPILDISAEHAVVQAGRPDISIIAHVHGSLRPAPEITFTSPNAGAGVVESDLVSYLLIGQPGFNFGENPSLTAALAAFLGPSFSAAITNTLGRSTGLTTVSFVGASPDVTKAFDLKNDPTRYITAGRVSGEFQLRSNVYFTVGSGLCVLGGTPQGQSALGEVIQDLGAQVEYRFTPMTRVQAGVEPSTQAQLCSPSFTNLPGLAPTPSQFSLSLSHIWRW